MDALILQKIKEEKRRQNQAYVTLNYFLQSVSYFDFFSKEAFSLCLKAQWMASFLGKNIITEEFFLFLFFDSNLEAIKFFQKYVTNEEALKIFLAKYDLNNSIKYRIKHFFCNLLFPPQEEILESIAFSDELYFLFEKASYNARDRFKTPVISPEILLITLMEEKNLSTFSLIKSFFQTENAWYLCRYQLMKKIHFHESTIRQEVPFGQQYFAYLLKTRLSDEEFNRLITEDVLGEGVSLFRNSLISLTLQENIFEHLQKDTWKLMKATKWRRYSS